MANLPSMLMPYVQSGRETDTIDLKRSYDLKKDNDKENLAKDICAIANTSERTGYLIIGVNDMKGRRKDIPVPGIYIESEEAFESQVSYVIDNLIENPPRVQVDFYDYEQKRICVIAISCTDRPHITDDGKTVYIRRSSHNREAKIKEILDMAHLKIGWEETYSVCEKLIQTIEGYHFSEDAIKIIADIVGRRIREVIDLVDQPIIHKYAFILSRSYFFLSHYDNSLFYIDRAIENKNDHRYLNLRAKIYQAYGKSCLEEFDKIDNANQMTEPLVANQEKFLLDCIEYTKMASADLHAAGELGGGSLEHLALRRELNQLQAQAQVHLDRISQLKEQDS